MATTATAAMLSHEVGESIPPHTAHVSHKSSVLDMRLDVADDDAHDKAVSVSLPTWKANVGYEEGEDWVLSKMKTGYPRSVIPTCHSISLL